MFWLFFLYFWLVNELVQTLSLFGLLVNIYLLLLSDGLHLGFLHWPFFFTAFPLVLNIRVSWVVYFFLLFFDAYLFFGSIGIINIFVNIKFGFLFFSPSQI